MNKLKEFLLEWVKLVAIVLIVFALFAVVVLAVSFFNPIVGIFLGLLVLCAIGAAMMTWL